VEVPSAAAERFLLLPADFCGDTAVPAASCATSCCCPCCSTGAAAALPAGCCVEVRVLLPNLLAVNQLDLGAVAAAAAAALAASLPCAPAKLLLLLSPPGLLAAGGMLAAGTLLAAGGGRGSEAGPPNSDASDLVPWLDGPGAPWPAAAAAAAAEELPCLTAGGMACRQQKGGRHTGVCKSFRMWCHCSGCNSLDAMLHDSCASERKGKQA
jgi:hypothetical protein